MRWGIRKPHATQSAQCVGEDEGERGGSSRARAFSFSSPLAWLGKLKGKESKPKNNTAAAPAPASCLPKRAGIPSPAPAVAPRRSPAPADVVPRRLSVGNDGSDAVAARRHSQHRRRWRHCSLGGDDREVLPLGHLIPFSLAGSSPTRTAPAARPSETDRRRTRRRKNHSQRRLSTTGSGRRSSFSGRMRAVPAVRVRASSSPRRRRHEHLAVVRRTRDPQRAFRESMVEMVARCGGRAEELERLLACYLSLNADEHHECIVKVFRQVWFEHVVNLMPPRLDPDAVDVAGRRR